MADLSCSRTNRKRSSFATKHFERKSLTIFDLHPPLRRLVPFVITKSEMLSNTQTDRQTDKQTHTQTHRPSTVTLAAHARRGLIRYSSTVPSPLIPSLLTILPPFTHCSHPLIPSLLTILPPFTHCSHPLIPSLLILPSLFPSSPHLLTSLPHPIIRSSPHPLTPSPHTLTTLPTLHTCPYSLEGCSLESAMN